ncbi:MAG: GNAT family N-acetyltransferase [Herminiimonas sp.]|nr:GNAT family N-acetyltransferase [Herminiimonas sp.]
MPSVHLKVATRSDAPELIALNLANREFHRPWVNPYTDQAGFDLWFIRTITGPNVGLVARRADNDEIVGVVNISEIVMGIFQSGYLGYYGTARSCRQGLMAESIALAVRFAFDELGLHRLEANIQVENFASITLIRKLGFAKEGISPAYLRINGEWRDHERWVVINQ